MIKKTIKYLFFICILNCAGWNPAFSQSSEAENVQAAKQQIEFTDEGIIVRDISTEELINLFEALEYKKYIYMPGWKYPPVFLERLPHDFRSIEDRNKRINLFIKIMIPLALRINEEISIERLELVNIRLDFQKNQDLTEEQRNRLEELAVRYDVFTRMKGLRRYNLLISKLDEKINIIPPSIIIANAAIETDWGLADIANDGNSLFKELSWYTDEGVKVDDKTDDSYRLKTFPTLYDSIRSFTLKINSNINYEIFRHARATVMASGKKPNGRNLAHNFYYNSNLKNFLGLLNYTITFYELTNIDTAKLGFPNEKDFRLPD